MATGTGKDALHPGRQGKQVRTTARRRFAPVKTATIEKSTTPPTPVAEDVEKTTFVRCWWEREVLQPPRRPRGRRLLSRRTLELPHGPDSTSGPKENQKHQDQTCSSVFRAASFTAAKTGTRPSVHGWIKKTQHIHAMECQPRKRTRLRSATWTDLEGVMLREVSQRKTNTVWCRLEVESKNNNELGNITERRQTLDMGKTS